MSKSVRSVTGVRETNSSLRSPTATSSAFVFARSRQETEGASRIAGYATKSISQNIVSGNMQIRVRPPIDAASDWALIRLSASSCKASLPIKTLDNEQIARAAQADQRLALRIISHDPPSSHLPLTDFKLWLH